MSINGDKKLMAQDKRRAKAEAKRSARRPRGGDAKGGAAQWHEVPPETIAEAVMHVTYGGGALLFSVTSDGGAFVVRVYDGGDSWAEYAASVNECVEMLRDLAGRFYND